MQKRPLLFHYCWIYDADDYATNVYPRDDNATLIYVAQDINEGCNRWPVMRVYSTELV
jgi:hypothetical protein